MTDDTYPDDEAFNDGAAPEVEDPTIAQLRAEIAEWKDHALRQAAEAENLKRRNEREMNDARAFAIQRFAKDLIGVADNLARALGSAPRGGEDAGLNTLITGVEMTEKELLQAFEKNGLKRIEPQKGDRFDPNQHQAMMEQASDEVAAGQVIQAFQAGYELFGRIVRPAMVVVASKGSGTGAGAYAPAAADTGEAVDTRA